MIENIKSLLKDIENNHKVKVVYACESGSRAWGFPSADSDYDVRFIYLHPLNWYLTVENKRDVIEFPVDNQLDISGWDLRKSLQLLRKSNPPLFEWLGSPIVYTELYSIAGRMRELSKTYYSSSACIYHYLHMAEGNFRQYLKGEQVWTKKYFYVLRPILAIKWIEQGYGVSPTAFGVLLERIITSKRLKVEIQKLIDLKREGAELDYGQRIPVISEFIEGELERLENSKAEYKSNPAPYDQLDKIFQDGLEEVWQFD
jgi:predicted nucleotidyltransferase